MAADMDIMGPPPNRQIALSEFALPAPHNLCVQTGRHDSQHITRKLTISYITYRRLVLQKRSEIYPKPMRFLTLEQAEVVSDRANHQEMRASRLEHAIKVSR